MPALSEVESKKDGIKAATEREAVRAQIELFHKKRLALRWKYNETDLEKAFLGFVCLMAGDWRTFAILGSLAVDVYIETVYPKNKVRAKFEIQKDVLKKLIKEYWKQGAAVTHNENFLELIEAIAPYTNDVEVLYPESMKNSQSRKLFSDQYRKILREPPHRLVIDKEVEQKAGADEKLAANPSAKAAVSSVGITIPTQNPADTKADSPTVLQSAYEYVTSWWSSTPETKPQPPKEQPSISKTEEASSQKANDKSRSSAAAVMPLLSAPATEVINATVGMATTKLQAGLNQAQLSQDTTAFATKAVTAVKTYANDTVKLFKDIRAIAPMTVAELTLRRYGEQTTEEPSAPAQISRKTL